MVEQEDGRVLFRADRPDTHIVAEGRTLAFIRRNDEHMVEVRTGASEHGLRRLLEALGN